MQCYPYLVIKFSGRMNMSVQRLVNVYERSISFQNVQGRLIVHIQGSFKSELDGEEYWTQKQNSAVAATLVCDNHKRIWHINVGWQGSVHDQRVFQNSALNNNPSAYFSVRKYLLGDSAYTPSPTLVPANKKFVGQIVLACGQVFFNDIVCLSCKN